MEHLTLCHVGLFRDSDVAVGQRAKGELLMRDALMSKGQKGSERKDKLLVTANIKNVTVKKKNAT